MNKYNLDLTINQDRFANDFKQLSKFGANSNNGVSRPTFSPAHLNAREWFGNTIKDGGLQFHVDSAGNYSGFLSSGGQGAPTLLIGSHLDSVIDGGKYDGALGVLAGLEVLRRVKESGIELPFNLEVIDFTDEEGTLISFLGSFALTGKLTHEHLQNPRGGKDALETGLKRAGLSPEKLFDARRDLRTIAGYIELHVEQGPLLYQNNTQIGVVDRISGISFYQLHYLGSAEHAGTASMQNRRDAAQGASAFTLAARKIILEQFPDGYSNVGMVEYFPGLFNVVPGKAVLSLEFRSADNADFANIRLAMLNEAQKIADQYHLGLEIDFLGEREPVSMHTDFQNAIRRSCEDLGLTNMKITSRAGHDAQSFASDVPTGMIFVPSARGISHSPEEFTPWEDCVNGANVLLQTVLRLADSYPAWTNQRYLKQSDN